jgi:beta-lactamase regulating signal transducer with metallopeptidase domain/thiol-disulfide isomerase/thioredoxin/protocatechuate 3,4-dioxygenase beta subunit
VQLLLPKLNGAAAIWFPFVYHAAWQASLLAVLLLAVVWLGRRWPSPLRYWLLLLALAKFALPPALSLPTGLFSRVGPAVRAVPSTADFGAAAPANPAFADLPVPLPDVSATPDMGDFVAEGTSAAPQAHSSSPVLDVRVWLMLLHAGGALAVGFWIVGSLIAMRRTLRGAAEVPDGELRRRFVGLSERLGLRHPPRLLLSPAPCGPAAFGVLRPVVVLPDAMASLGASALDAILAHELAHHRRRDPCINWVQLTLTAVWWFNPLLWVLNRQIRRVREDCCDDLLLTRNLTTAPAYCDTLLSAASKLTERAVPGLSLGFGDSLHPLGRRFERIMDQTLRRTPRLSLSGIFVLALLATVVLPGLRRSDGDEPAAEKVGDEKVVDEKVAADKTAADVNDVAPAADSEWPEGATVTGRVVNHRGAPVANAEVLLLGAERIIVDALRRNWFVPGQQNSRPASTRTDKNGAFAITRKHGTADRLGVISDDPLFWVVSRKSVARGDNIEIKLPAAGSLAVRCDLPGKPPKLPVIIQSKTFDGVTWNADSLRFHDSRFSLDNPGETLFEHIPPGQYAVQRFQETKTDPGTTLMTDADRQLVEIESAKRASIRIERKTGRPLFGLVRGLEAAELRYAYVTIYCPGPEEVLGNDGKLARMNTAFDVIPITSDGRFTTDPIPPGNYSAHLFAVLASTPQLSSTSSDFSGSVSFTVPEKGAPPNVMLDAKANGPRDPSKISDLRVRVVDEDGKGVPKAEAMVHTADQGYGHWTAGQDGLVFLGGAWQYRGSALQVLMRAEGYASAIAHFAGAAREKLSKGEATITLRRGQKVQLRFNLPEGMTWPKGTLPEVYFDDMQERVRIMRQPSNRRSGVVSDFNMLNLKEVGPGRFELQLADDTPRFHVAVHAAGFLQFFETGPFTFADAKNGKIEIDIPRPATLDVSFQPGDDPDANSLFKGASLDVMRQLQGNSYLSVASSGADSLTPRLKLTDLAPGHYLVDVRTQPQDNSKPLAGTEINVGSYFDRKIVMLEGGQTERIDFRSVPFDPDAFRGTRKAVLHITTPDGSPANDRNVSVTRFDGHYGSQVVFSGMVSESGDVVLTGITDAKLPASYSAFSPYQVSVDGKRLGSFGFNDETTERFEFVLAPVAGDMAPDVKLTSLTTGQVTSLSSFRGKVVFLEFWATWCGPCQDPMSKLNALGGEQKPAWKDRAAIVPVSIDAEQARVRSHVQQREWTGVEHFWSGGPEGADFESPAARAFVVSSVPQSVLIGRDGRILWRGHPLDQTDGLDVKSRIEQALK